MNVNNNNYTCCAKMAGKEETPTCRKKTVTWTNRLHRNTSHRRLRSHLRAHVDLFLELNLLRSTIIYNNAIQRAAPSSPSKNAILFAVSSAKNCVYSSKFLASCIHKLEFKFSWMATWMQNLYRVYRVLRRKTGWLGTECGDNMSTRGLLSQFTSTIYSSSIKQILSSFH